MSVLEIFKIVTSYASKAKNPELMEIVLKLQTGYMELLNDNNQLRERVHGFEKEIETLKRKRDIEKSLTIENGVYFIKTVDENGQITDPSGPFCTSCWDVDNNLVLLHVHRDESATCPHCDFKYDFMSRPSSRQNHAET